MPRPLADSLGSLDTSTSLGRVQLLYLEQGRMGMVDPSVKYQGRALKILLDSPSKFDRELSSKARNMILDAAISLQTTTILSLAAFLGVNRNRLGRIITDLDLRADLARLKQRFQK